MPTPCLLPVAAQSLARVGQRSRLPSSRINNIKEVTAGGNFVCMVADCLCVYMCVYVFVCLEEAYLINIKGLVWTI